MCSPSKPPGLPIRCPSAATLWVSWPKKTSGVVNDLSDVMVRDAGLKLGLVDIKVCAVDAVWSGLKFVIPKEARATRKK
jgi:hypothetical protein